MSDHADDALMECETSYEAFTAARLDGDLALYEEGFIDEVGRSYFGMYAHRQKESGPGACPLCDGPTVERNGKFGKFFGCSNFPDCKGSRNYV